MPFLDLIISDVSSSSSRERIIWLTADCVYPIFSAVLVKLPFSVIIIKASYLIILPFPFISMSNKYIIFIRFTYVNCNDILLP
ncbi:hypothetical protein SDC9_112159 [bioreactor metagenome]|uniref:Uncharacterized protein n=1 Tax=bioreactor metagenome TaxID=1076179 RepID=A0A645BTZ0_9ZZZZ